MFVAFIIKCICLIQQTIINNQHLIHPLVLLLLVQINMKQNLVKKEQQFKSYTQIVLIALNACLSSVFVGYSFGYLNSIEFQDIIAIYQIQSQNASVIQGFLTGIMQASAGLGAFLSKYMLAHLSRRQCFIKTNYAIFIILAAIQIRNVWVLAFVRVLQGICMGLTSSFVPLYIKELVPKSMSGSIGTLNQGFMSLGIFLSYFFTYLFSLFTLPQTYWRYIFAFPIVFVSLQTLLFIKVFPYQTPKYLISIHRNQEAIQLIKIIYKQQFVTAVFQQKLKDLAQIKSQFELQPADHHMQNSDSPKSRLHINIQQLGRFGNKPPAKIQRKTNRVAILAAINTSILPNMVGVSIVVLYAGDIAKRVLPSLTKTFPLILHMQGIGATFFTMHLLKTKGRVDLIEFGAFGIAVLSLIVSLGFLFGNSSSFSQIIILVSLMIYRGLFSLTLGPILWIYISQILQPNIIPYVTMLNFAMGCLTTTLFPIITDLVLQGNPGFLFMYFAAYGFISYFIGKRIMIQTKDKTQYQIRESYELKFPPNKKITSI